MEIDRRINGTTLLTGLIGNPVAHTVSPFLHNTLFQQLGLNGIYLPLHVPAGGLGDAVKGLKAIGFRGFNVTIPYKSDILQYADEISEDVRLLGVSNTILIRDGRLYAHNTDAEGFTRAFREQTGTGFNGKKVCVLGAGGTAKALSIKIALEGASEIIIVNRTMERAQELADTINAILSTRGSGGKACAVQAGTKEAYAALSDCEILVNTTSVGMHPLTDACPLPHDFPFKSKQIIYDTIYNPKETKLLINARECGSTVVNGAGMLLHQGLRAFEIWMEMELPKSLVEDLSDEFYKILGN